MDYFNRLILHLEQSNKIRGVFIKEGCNLTHLLFADNILLFMEPKDEYITNVRSAIFIFEVSLGLNFNLSNPPSTP